MTRLDLNNIAWFLMGDLLGPSWSAHGQASWGYIETVLYIETDFGD